MRKIILATITALAVAGSLAVASPAMAERGPKFSSPICHATEVKDHHEDGHENKRFDGNKDKVYTFETVVVTEHNARQFFDERGKLKNSPPDYLGACVVPTPDVPVVGPTAAPEGPGPYLQAYGLVSDPTCQLTPDWAKWEGVPDGGWNPSWGEWMNGGTGGAVCQRTVELVGGVWTIAK
jgi:hypothetical protein